jgi:hypothetical protein
MARLQHGALFVAGGMARFPHYNYGRVGGVE